MNDAPTLTAFTAAVGSGNEDSQITVSFANLQTQGDDADVDSAVSAFVVKAIASGTLLIGADLGSATPWAAGSNEVIDSSHSAFWTPAANANGNLNAFTVVAKDAEGLESATPVQTTVDVTPVNDLATGNVTISGTAKQGQTLTASNTLADVDGLGAISYQWKAGGVVIAGATNSTYKPGQLQASKAITVTAKYTDGFGTIESKTSAATAKVVNVNDLPTGTVTITGTAEQGQTLTASHTLKDLDGLGVVGYQWLAMMWR